MCQATLSLLIAVSQLLLLLLPCNYLSVLALRHIEKLWRAAIRASYLRLTDTRRVKEVARCLATGCYN